MIFTKTPIMGVESRNVLLLCLFVIFISLDAAVASPLHIPSKAVCKVRRFKKCFMAYLSCPCSCPTYCEVDCVTCKPVCRCDKPGAVCQDPRFIGGDGVTFYFHGKKDRDFCLVSDPNLHINAHFIGKRGEGMHRDFTWVQSIAIMYGSHQVYIGANKVATWDDTVDHLTVRFDGAKVELPTNEGAKWVGPRLCSITRTENINGITFEAPGHFMVSASVVPITKEESLVHNYGIGDDDCFAHLDLRFKFFSLSSDVDGVLGQTYQDGYVSPVKIGASMPIMGGEKKYISSSLFATDCAAARFNHASVHTVDSHKSEKFMSCTGGFSGRGLVCKK